MKCILKILLFISLMSGECIALTANEFLDLNARDRVVWVTGVIDGLLTEELIRTVNQPKLAICLAEYRVNQITAIYIKHFK
ncbi:hypothetical protein [Exilibacterium tricleocarpae]|uniref:hypothetical protein n=1 Tax=Exilibacterium tricleocarpae TaxID=2591008 RepID=UPI00115C58C2|nr:hypothetical protein [Exilibacterium tricleocarpae]